ncbi:Transferase [Penicillium robsamsonii]|uniref:Transferase n=1 Tax=Penicillium robsamsonii TaxID=1792511 RepID=UPI0025467416|nr:Transferase [Penicillium robsamsonii]KAJ5823776.1 Transferase [Penicillium robsamsonii]
MGSIMSEQPIPELTALERIGPKGYLRYIFPFQLQEDYDLDEVIGVLQAGYQDLIQRIPEVGCEAVPDVSLKQRGVMKLQKPANEDIGRIVVKDLRESYESDYAELKGKSFPVASFDADTFCARSVWPSAGDQLPISLVQANFIRGGLVLSWCIFHMVGDGTTFYTWTNIWAEACRRAQGLNIQDPIQLPEAIWKDRAQVTKSSGRNAGKIEDHPEYTLLPFTPPGAPPKMTSLSHRGQIFYFSPESLAAIKAEASPGNATEPSDQKWISTNDALAALLWRTVMAAQSPLETLEGDPMSVYNIAIDGRQRTDPKLHPETLGCFLEYVSVSVPVRKILSTLSLADLATKIRKALIAADEQFTDDVVTLVEQVEDVDRLVPTAFLDVPGFNCVLTSWVNFKMYGLEWGPLLGNNIEAIRVPHVGCINGGQVVLPVLPNGGMEILVGVEGSSLDRLLNDPLFTKYGVAR